jgi:zinc transporter 2
MAGTLGVHGHSHGPGAAHGHGHSHGDGDAGGGGDAVADNINVRAAYIHVLGDMVQSVGVMIASALIWYRPAWHILDPVCTIVFACVVLLTTVGLLKEALHVLMEGTPRGIDPERLRRDLEKVPGVLLAHDMHIWSISVAQPAIAMHLTVEPEDAVGRDRILLAAQDICLAHGIAHMTIQLERYEGSHCHVAQDDVTIQIQRRSTVTGPLLALPPNNPSPVPE